MPDRLTRHTPTTGRGRYGSWDLSLDRDPALQETTGKDDRQDKTGGPHAMEDREHPDEEQVLLLIRRQRRLSLTMAVLLFGPVFAFVVAAIEFQGAMAVPVWHGFSVSFLLAAVVVYVVTWVVAIVYAVLSNRMDGLR